MPNGIERPGSKTTLSDPAILGWFQDPGAIRGSRVRSSRAKTEQTLLNLIGMPGQSYFSILQSGFAFTLRSLRELEPHALWLARDGAMPLSWFFRRFPSPGRIRGALLIHESLACLVPSKWMGRIGTYQIEWMPQKDRTSVNGLILFVPSGRFFDPVEGLGPRLEGLARIMKNRQKFGRIKEALLLSDSGGQALSSRRAIQRAVKSSLKLSARWIEAKQLYELGRIEDFAYADLGGKWVCADNFVTHVALASGAYWIESRFYSGSVIPLSPAHGIRIRFPMEAHLAQNRGLRFKEMDEAAGQARRKDFSGSKSD